MSNKTLELPPQSADNKEWLAQVERTGMAFKTAIESNAGRMPVRDLLEIVDWVHEQVLFRLRNNIHV